MVVVTTTEKEEINIQHISQEQITSIVRYASDSTGYTPFKFLAIMHVLNKLNFEEECLGLCKITYEGQPTNTEAFCLQVDGYILNLHFAD